MQIKWKKRKRNNNVIVFKNKIQISYKNRFTCLFSLCLHIIVKKSKNIFETKITFNIIPANNSKLPYTEFPGYHFIYAAIQTM